MTWVPARLCKLQKGCTRLAAASDKVYQLLAHGRWFFLGTPASSTTKTGRHDIAEILLKVALNTKNQKSSTFIYIIYCNREQIIANQQHFKRPEKHSINIRWSNISIVYCTGIFIQQQKNFAVVLRY